MFCMFLADGFEETEALATLDVLRRAEINVQTVGVTGKTVIGSHAIPVIADVTIDNVNLNDIDGVVLPGGMPGTTNLQNNQKVLDCVMAAYKGNKPVCAICAAPSVLGSLGVLKGKKATCFPGFEDKLLGANVSSAGVVADGNVVTAKGAGVSLEFGFKITELVKGKDVADKLREIMQCNSL